VPPDSLQASRLHGPARWQAQHVLLLLGVPWPGPRQPVGRAPRQWRTLGQAWSRPAGRLKSRVFGERQSSRQGASCSRLRKYGTYRIYQTYQSQNGSTRLSCRHPSVNGPKHSTRSGHVGVSELPRSTAAQHKKEIPSGILGSAQRGCRVARQSGALVSPLASGPTFSRW
jgi:hypothetical protein